MTLWSWSRIYHASLTKVVMPQAIPIIDRLAGLIERWFDLFSRRAPTGAPAPLSEGCQFRRY
jgi:hypothetical protein